MKKLVSLIVGLALCLGLTSFAFAEGPAPVASEQLDAIETALYGTHQSSSMMERMESLEDDIYGAPDSGRNIPAIFWTVYRAPMNISVEQTAAMEAFCRS